MRNLIELAELDFRPAKWEGYINADAALCILGYYVPALEDMLDDNVQANTTVTLGDGTVFDVYQKTDADGDVHSLLHNRELNLTTTGTNEIYNAGSLKQLTQQVPVVHGTNEQFAAIIAGL